MSRTTFAHAVLAVMIALFVSESVGAVLNYVEVQRVYAQGTEDCTGVEDLTGMNPEDCIPGTWNPASSESGGETTNIGGETVNPTPGPNQTQSGGSNSLKNPLQSTSIQEFLGKIIDILLIFALPIIVLFIMYAGFLYVTARGDTGKIEKAHSALLWSVVGGVIILAAKLISEVLKATVTAL